ncbi:response regulator [Nocardioides marmorisolisilvae]|uniref:DNA-binding response regulator n=1 Tax=Nocardioides marmorisolisilvae TaxID=1542737 RepID=A0A3N0DZJ2_9ACTN|nr:response regulator transcription factor [Nocardioides marmorisolisilvae]RNL80903.1 DNA-binding response regulator [Nocardioides marmorisolisilvae]
MRVIVADDSALLRTGLVRLLQDAGVSVLAEVGDADAAVAAAIEHEPDVAILDIRMPPGNRDDGVRAADTIRSERPAVGILLLSAHLQASAALHLVERHRVGGFGYLLKDHVAGLEVMVDALERVAAGETVLDPDVVSAIVGRGANQARLDRLTAREREVLSLMAEGRSNAAICRRLSMAARTVETHIASIFTKLDLLVVDDDHRRVRAVLAHLGVDE